MSDEGSGEELFDGIAALADSLAEALHCDKLEDEASSAAIKVSISICESLIRGQKEVPCLDELSGNSSDFSERLRNSFASIVAGRLAINFLILT